MLPTSTTLGRVDAFVAAVLYSSIPWSVGNIVYSIREPHTRQFPQGEAPSPFGMDISNWACLDWRPGTGRFLHLTFLDLQYPQALDSLAVARRGGMAPLSKCVGLRNMGQISKIGGKGEHADGLTRTGLLQSVRAPRVPSQPGSVLSTVVWALAGPVENPVFPAFQGGPLHIPFLVAIYGSVITAEDWTWCSTVQAL